MKIERILAIGSSILLLGLLGALSFDGSEITVEANSPKVFQVSTSWWGLRRAYREIRWRKPDGLDFEAWCAQAPDGTWYLAVRGIEDDARSD